MPYTNFTAVSKLVEVDTTISNDLAPFIEMANALVVELLTPIKKTDGSLYYDSTRLEQIERWLSAHFYTIRDPHRSSESVGVSESYQRNTGLYLDQSTYGQMAITMDTTGTLAAWNQRMKEGRSTAGPMRRTVSVTWLGTESSE